MFHEHRRRSGSALARRVGQTPSKSRRRRRRRRIEPRPYRAIRVRCRVGRRGVAYIPGSEEEDVRSGPWAPRGPTEAQRAPKFRLGKRNPCAPEACFLKCNPSGRRRRRRKHQRVPIPRKATTRLPRSAAQVGDTPLCNHNTTSTRRVARRSCVRSNVNPRRRPLRAVFVKCKPGGFICVRAV